ncbi:hypothetical protein BBO99_00005758 [Phytophthora kernoviae]|uniref:Uncharacterized protein n=1 Tax=Phytophthora kernoviae TaxID=325452 RepID=A0A3R7JAU3_9STRA|nr:hypothetical protein BBI17_005770 [Phytophthora kernoviae]RLN78730.1 hypothetical protein BBO99_00005758 [Phytophthora kernoviae]
MQSHELTQRELEAQLEHAQAKIRASKAEEQQVEKDQWEHERDRQLEIFVQQRSALDAIRAQTESLDAEELRLQAEMEVIRERQQEVSETEAQHIRRLVHERTSLLEEELAKGKMDLDYIARVISTTRHQELKQGTQREAHKATSSSVQSLVQDVQERRRREFDGSEANFRERMQTFQLEKEALAKKAKALRVTKQRALQILSQNQQFAIKEYFDTTPPAQPRETNEKSIPSLDFGEILQSLNQSGAYVEQVQNLDSERNSGRRELADGLKDARLTIEQGPGRIKAIQKHLANRKEEAQKLGIVVELIGR